MADKVLGKVTHFFDNISVAVVRLEKGVRLKKGDSVHFGGNKTDFVQSVDSMQVDGKDVESVKTGDDFGLKVKKPVREGDLLKTQE